jgi:hypothetical protein
VASKAFKVCKPERQCLEKASGGQTSITDDPRRLTAR